MTLQRVARLSLRHQQKRVVPCFTRCRFLTASRLTKKAILMSKIRPQEIARRRTSTATAATTTTADSEEAAITGISDDQARDIALRLKECDCLYILAGAGMSVDSGLPDFRSDLGFWKSYPPMQDMNLSFTEMANPLWFDADPALAWAFYGHRLNLYRRTQPHKGFAMLLEMSQHMAHGYRVFTSNVDGHFQKAGFDEQRIEERHGSIHYLQCVEGPRCVMRNDDYFPNGIASIEQLEKRGLKPISDEVLDSHPEKKPPGDKDRKSALDEEKLPPCLCRIVGHDCTYGPRLLSRPNILMFDDSTFNPHRALEQNDRAKKFFKEELVKRKEKMASRVAVVEIGAGSALPVVRIEAEEKAYLYGHVFARINRDKHDSQISSSFDCPHIYSIQDTSLNAIAAIYDHFKAL